MFNNYFKAIATMVGAIIGVGMFSLPYTISRAGILPFLIYFPVLVAVQHYMHKVYAEIILSTKTRHRVPGYIRRYFGKTPEKFAYIIVLFSLNISALAYIIVGGIFLTNLLYPIVGGNVFFYSTMLFSIVALVSYFGINLLSSVESIMTVFLVVVIALISYKGLYFVKADNYILIDWSNIFLPYGPILFAIGGATSIPVVCHIMAWQKKKIKSAIFLGTMIPSVLIFIFALVVAGITGANTTEAALTGLNQVLGNGVSKISLIFGLLAVTTSLLVTMDTLFEIYKLDMKLTKIQAWFFAVLVPYGLYALGFNSAIKVISLAGAVVGGLIGIIYLLLLMKVHNKPERKSLIVNLINKKIAVVLSFIFLMGIIYEIHEIFFKAPTG